ncbi:MAG: hypothetical protein LBG43_02725 [Treponema sp.]|jgi:hypothetical protein|nr:hypothetical protein [Treponema sp.]
MFNQIDKIQINCKQGNMVYQGESSYIKSVKWSNFKEKPQEYIKTAIEIKKNIGEYEIRKEI